MSSPDGDGEVALRALVDEWRDRCLWFLARGYYPETTAEQVRALESIQRHGDLDAFKQAGELKRWVLAHTSAASASS